MTTGDRTHDAPLTSRQRRLAIALLSAAAAVRLALILTTDATTRLGPYIDDAYMSHKIAMNIAQGRGITQAGEPTNGFQPLFVFLLVPVYLVCDANQALTVSATLNAAMNLGCAMFVFRLLRRLFGARVGLIGMALFLSSSFFVRVAFNGLETTLANLLMLAVLDAHLAARHSPHRLTWLGGLSTGALSGLAVLARLDLAMLMPLLLVDQCALHRRVGGLGKVACAIVAGAAVVAPWLYFSVHTCHRLTPISGPATRAIAQLYASPKGPVREPAYFPLGAPPWSFRVEHTYRAAGHILLDTPLAMPVAVFLKDAPALAPAWLAAIFLAAFIAHRRFPPDHIDAGRLRRLCVELWPAWAFVALLVMVYGFYVFGSWGFWRYMTPGSILLILPSALWLDAIISSAMNRRSGVACAAATATRESDGLPQRTAGASVVSVAGATVVIGAWVAAAVVGHARLFGPINPAINEPRMLHDALALRDIIPADGRVAATESGILDYFLGRDVINLDGKTNAAACAALVHGTMDQYLDDAGVDYVLSSPLLLRDLILRRGHWPQGRLEPVMQLQHFVLLRVHRPAPAVP